MVRYLLLVLAFLVTYVQTSPAAVSGPLTIAYNPGVAPLKFVGKSGEAAGLLPDTWRLIGQKLGQDVSFIQAAGFSQSLEMVKTGQADFHAGIFKTAEREKFLTYTPPLFQVDYYIFTNPLIAPVNRLEDLRGLFVGITKGGYTEKRASEVLPQHLLPKK